MQRHRHATDQCGQPKTDEPVMATGTVSEALWPRFSRSNDLALSIVLEDFNHPRDVWLIS